MCPGSTLVSGEAPAASNAISRFLRTASATHFLLLYTTYMHIPPRDLALQQESVSIKEDDLQQDLKVVAFRLPKLLTVGSSRSLEAWSPPAGSAGEYDIQKQPRTYVLHLFGGEMHCQSHCPQSTFVKCILGNSRSRIFRVGLHGMITMV